VAVTLQHNLSNIAKNGENTGRDSSCGIMLERTSDSSKTTIHGRRSRFVKAD
jgi:hypothetical protein